MSDFNLYRRMHEFGTLSEEPQDVPDPTFALPSTINWMRALALVIEDQRLDFRSAHTFYGGVQRQTLADNATNSVCEQLLFSLNQLASLLVMANAPVAAADRSFQDNHAATAQQWDRQFPANRLAMAPFSDRLSSLESESVTREIEVARRRGKHPLTTPPASVQQAWGCCAEYLSGTASWEQWNVRMRLLEHRDFKALGVSNFRTTAARALRDSWYAKRSVSFLHQASRYRGKANYRDAIYLAYGKSVPRMLEGFVGDLAIVLSGFSAMAAGYISVRIGRDLWLGFLEDIEAKRSISISPRSIWS